MLENVDLQNLWVLDIETVPQYPNYTDVPELFRDLWEQKTLYQRRNGETAEEFYERAGIWAEFGKIICISIGIFTRTAGQQGFRVKSFYGHDEAEVLKSFSDLLNTQPANLMLCAHN